MPKAADVTVDLQKQAEAAALLKDELQKFFAAELLANPDDASTLRAINETIADTISGATMLEETVTKAIEAVAECGMIVDGIAPYLAKLHARAKRFEDRIEYIRGLVHMAMAAGGQRKYPLAIATVSLNKARARVLIDDESKVPADYWRRPDPVVDKTKLNEVAMARHKALAALDDIKDEQAKALERARVDALLPPLPGVHVEDGGTTLHVKFS